MIDAVEKNEISDELLAKKIGIFSSLKKYYLEIPFMVRWYILLSISYFIYLFLTGCNAVPKDYLNALEKDLKVVVPGYVMYVDNDPDYLNVKPEFLNLNPNWIIESKNKRKEIAEHCWKVFYRLKNHVEGKKE